jgi:hypothetical protein
MTLVPMMRVREAVTRTQFALAILVAVVLALGLGWLIRHGGFEYAGERFRDTAAALKRMYRERTGSGAPRQQPLQDGALPPGRPDSIF